MYPKRKKILNKVKAIETQAIPLTILLLFYLEMGGKEEEEDKR